MFNNGCKTIGMLISGVSSTFQKFLCKELTDLCLDMGYNLAIFNVFGGSSYEDVEAYAVGETNILNLIPYEEFAGLITVPDTFVSKSLRNKVVETIKKRVTCPVVSVRTQIDGFYSLVIDNTVAMNDMISHFIEKHGKTKIAFLNGPKDHPEAIDRLTSYRNTMAKYNIPVREDWILYGDFWLNLGGYYADYYFKDKEKSEWPEVIVCANDYMAIAVCDECLKRGIKIPEEVMVSGFDNLPETMSCYPLISTVEVSISDIAKKCMDVFNRLEKGEKAEPVQFIKTEDFYRASCGCKATDIMMIYDSILVLRKDYASLFNSTRGSTYMSVSLQSLENYEEIRDVLFNSRERFRSLFVCIMEKGKGKAKTLAPRKKGYSKKMRCIYGHYNYKAVDDSVFDTGSIIPDNVACEGPVQFYITPLHYQDNTYGYVVHSYEDGVCFDREFQNWMVVMGNAFENIFTKIKYSELVDELNNQYIHESMTGLYNRRGFDILSQQMYEQSIEEQKRLLLIEIDMDNLKRVNDLYGHSEGDKAIDVIADALKKSATQGEICARVGGDEFWVVGYGYDKFKMDEYIARLKANLEEFDSLEAKPYRVEVSYGVVLTDPCSGITLEEYINIVDTRMYRNKRDRKKQKKNFEE